MMDIRLTRAAYLVCATIAATAAQSAEEFTNSSGGTFQYYGQFSPAILSFDDGGQSSTDFVDNTNSNSRIGFWIRQPLNTGRLSFNLETAFGFRGSAGVNQLIKDDSLSWTRADLRKAEFIWETGQYGTFSFGQGSMASDGVATVDQSGTTLVSYVSIGDTAGAYVFRTSTGALSTVPMAAAFATFDGGRRGRVRYDTPSFSGFSLSASYGEQILISAINTKDYDLALRYAKELGDFKVRGALAYAWSERETLANTQSTIGSLSVLHSPTGFSATLAAGSRDVSGEYGYIKLGYRDDFFAFGETAMSIDYYDGRDMVSAGSSSGSIGAGVVQKIDKLDLEAYLGYRMYEYSDTSGTTYQDANSILFGARWKF